MRERRKRRRGIQREGTSNRSSRGCRRSHPQGTYPPWQVQDISNTPTHVQLGM
jgi:hypothetical protein